MAGQDRPDQYSDMPPPTGTPDEDILQRPCRGAPRRRQRRRPPRRRRRRRAGASQPATPSWRPSARRPSRKKRQGKGRGRPHRRGQGRELRPRQGSAEAIEDGLRMSRTNANGEREYLDDKGRAEEAKRIAQHDRVRLQVADVRPSAAPAARGAGAALPSGPPPTAGTPPPGRRRADASSARTAAPDADAGFQPGSAPQPLHESPRPPLPPGAARAPSGAPRRAGCRRPRRHAMLSAPPSARPVHLLGAVHERVDEGVGDAVEHRADRRPRAPCWRTRSAARTRSCRPRAQRLDARRASGRNRQWPSSSENGPSTRPTSTDRSGDVLVARGEGMAHAGDRPGGAAPSCRRRRCSAPRRCSHQGRNSGSLDVGHQRVHLVRRIPEQDRLLDVLHTMPQIVGVARAARLT